MAPVTQAIRLHRRTWGEPRHINSRSCEWPRVLSQLQINEYRLTFRAATARTRGARAGLALEVCRDSREGPEG